MKFSPSRLAVQLAASLALSVGFAAAAHADDYTIFQPVTATTGTQLSGSFSQAIAAGDFTITLWAEGATEYDQFLTAAAGSGVSFSGVSAYIMSSDDLGNPVNAPVSFFSNSVTASALSTAVHDQSASFIIYTITGTATAAGTITGTVLDNTAYTPAAAVPEPTTWALMLGGLGLVATRLNKRRRA